MCTAVPGYSLKLHMWYKNPRKKGETAPTTCEFRGGHCSLEIVTPYGQAYLGWWPRWRSVERDRGERAPKLPEVGWFPAKVTKYCTQSHAPAGTHPDLIDSILVGNQEVGRTPVAGPWYEVPPSITYDLCVEGVKLNQLLSYVDDLKVKANAHLEKYQFATNNCATVCAAALKAGGVAMPHLWPPFWSPYYFEKFCLDLNCTKAAAPKAAASSVAGAA